MTSTLARIIAANFDAAQSVARIQYWSGVKDAQCRRSIRRDMGADYNLGVWHVARGVIPMKPLAQVHDSPEFREDPHQ